MGWPWITCPQCRREPQLVPMFGGFTLQCGCPPIQTHTGASTAPLNEVKDMQTWPDEIRKAHGIKIRPS